MRRGTEFEVTKEVYERAAKNRGYMHDDDREKYFSADVICGYGLYDCRVREQDGKYICSYMTGSSCD